MKKYLLLINLLAGLFIILLAFPNIAYSITNDQTSATVQIICKDSRSGNWYSGSGTIFDSSGIVLTNRHVVEGSNNAIIKNCLIGLVNNSNQEPDFSYIAETKYWTTTSDKDAAILYIDNKTNKVFPSVDIFNSDSSSLHFGDKIEVLGYPSIGGSTLTYTDGTYSGMGSSSDGTKNYIKTTAILGHGNSGGSAYGNGKFVGIPTMVVSDIGITNSIGYILSVNSIKAWLSGILGSSYQNKIVTYEPSINNKTIALPNIITPSDISELSVSSFQSIESDFANQTLAFRLSHPAIAGVTTTEDNNKRWTSVLMGDIKGFYLYFGKDISADPINTNVGVFVTDVVYRFPAPKISGVYYLIVRLKSADGNISDKAVYGITYNSSFKCQLVTSISNANTGEKFRLRCEGASYCKPIVPGGIPLKIEWGKESINSGFSNYNINWSSSDYNGIFADRSISHSVEEIKECEKWGGTQTENVFYLPALRYGWQYYAGLGIQYSMGNINRSCDLVEINTLPEGTDYKQYLLPAETSVAPENETFNIKASVLSLRVRSLPSLSGKIITSISNKKIYSVVEQQNGWYKIYYTTNKTGWIMSQYTKIIK